MTTNYVNTGETVEFTPAAVVSPGQVIVRGDCVGISLNAAAAAGDPVTLALRGRYTVAKVTGVAWNQGDRLDWDLSAQKFTKGLSTAVGDVADCAVAAVDAASGDATADIILDNPGTLDIAS